MAANGSLLAILRTIGWMQMVSVAVPLLYFVVMIANFRAEPRPRRVLLSGSNLSSAVARTVKEESWWTMSISDYASARGTTGHKLLAAATAIMGALQIAGAIVLHEAGICTWHTAVLIAAGVGSVVLGQTESDKGFEVFDAHGDGAASVADGVDGSDTTGGVLNGCVWDPTHAGPARVAACICCGQDTGCRLPCAACIWEQNGDADLEAVMVVNGRIQPPPGSKWTWQRDKRDCGVLCWQCCCGLQERDLQEPMDEPPTPAPEALPVPERVPGAPTRRHIVHAFRTGVSSARTSVDHAAELPGEYTQYHRDVLDDRLNDPAAATYQRPAGQPAVAELHVCFAGCTAMHVPVPPSLAPGSTRTPATGASGVAIMPEHRAFVCTKRWLALAHALGALISSIGTGVVEIDLDRGAAHTGRALAIAGLVFFVLFLVMQACTGETLPAWCWHPAVCMCPQKPAYRYAPLRKWRSADGSVCCCLRPYAACHVYLNTTSGRTWMSRFAIVLELLAFGLLSLCNIVPNIDGFTGGKRMCTA